MLARLYDELHTIVDKLVIGFMILYGGLKFNSLLEKFKRTQNEQFEKFRVEILGQIEAARMICTAIGEPTPSKMSWSAASPESCPRARNAAANPTHDRPTGSWFVREDVVLVGRTGADTPHLAQAPGAELPAQDAVLLLEALEHLELAAVYPAREH